MNNTRSSHVEATLSIRWEGETSELLALWNRHTTGVCSTLSHLKAGGHTFFEAEGGPSSRPTTTIRSLLLLVVARRHAVNDSMQACRQPKHF